MTAPAFDLEGRVAVITGGAGAIGRAICKAFAEAGAHVAVIDLRAEPAGEVAGALPGGAHVGFGADLRDVAAMPALMDRIEASLGQPTILINIAGVIRRSHDLFAVTEADWDLQHDTNLKSVFFLCQAFAARLVCADRAGAIVNYTSQGWMSGGFGGSVVYNAAKGGITTMTRGLARSWAKNRIRVNAVAPGLVATPMLMTPEMSAEQLAGLEASIPAGRFGTPEDHIGATLFLASDLAAYVTGATLNVSGGFLMY